MSIFIGEGGSVHFYERGREGSFLWEREGGFIFL